MIWWQSECKFGDMIRISFGNFYHYGIFVSEDEVIQFGLPPFEGLLNRKFEDIAVCVSDIDTFSGGKTVEVATAERSKKEKRLSPKKTVRRARERIGEKGYDILHNNCEHFARYCYFGEKRCEVTEGVVSEWKSKTVCDVYFSRIPDAPEYDELFPKERNDEVVAVSNEAVKRSKYWAWKTLEYALFRSFGYKIRELDIKKTKSGKWVCKECFFSISHTEDTVAVAVSNRETGIDIEGRTAFCERFGEKSHFDAFVKRVLSRKEAYPADTDELLCLWTKKECLFKAGKKGSFVPSRVCTAGKDLTAFSLSLDGRDYVASVIGKDTSVYRFYVYDSNGAVRYKDIKWI